MKTFQSMLATCLFVLPTSAQGRPNAKAQGNSNSGYRQFESSSESGGNSNNGGSSNRESSNGGNGGGGGGGGRSGGNGANGGNGGFQNNGGSQNNGDSQFKGSTQSNGGGQFKETSQNDGGSQNKEGSQNNGGQQNNNNNNNNNNNEKGKPEAKDNSPPPPPSNPTGNKGPKKGVSPPSTRKDTSTETETETSTSTSTLTPTSTETSTSTSETLITSITSPAPQPAATTSTTDSTSLESSSTTTSTTSDTTSLLSSVSTEPVSTSSSDSPSSTSSSSSAITTSITPAFEYSSATDLSLPATPTAVTITESHRSSHNRTLVITLSVVFGILGLALILGAIYLFHLYRTGRRPFGQRGVTPIHDDEIATWRRSGTSTIRENPAIGSILASPIEKEPIPMMPEVSLGYLTHNSGWNWSIPSSPTSTTRPGFTSGLTLPDTPSFLARAPNARAGLTDETVPGEDPFILPVKRQSSRLSKAPPGHGRSKSRRSSFSGKSIMSVRSTYVPPLSAGPRTPQSTAPTWYDPDDESRWRRIRDLEYTTSPPVINHIPAGLSPRPTSSVRPGTGRTIA